MLREHGLEPGDRVAVYLEKSCEEAYAIFGTSMAGGVIVPVNPLLRPRQVAHILGDCGVRFLITTARRLPSWAAILDGAQSLQRVLVVDEIAVPADDRAGPRAFARPRPAPPPASRGSRRAGGDPLHVGLHRVCRRAPC